MNKKLKMQASKIRTRLTQVNKHHVMENILAKLCCSPPPVSIQITEIEKFESFTTLCHSSKDPLFSDPLGHAVVIFCFIFISL